ncbi:MAG: response regulator [Tannerellaceae bacterium]|jgi:signal transduction histidine kinase/ligand-binding sensor domain-containing protein/DNA-binding response OmpR family regulator|nr:response regulator [Tannerellaceae bacterium]
MKNGLLLFIVLLLLLSGGRVHAAGNYKFRTLSPEGGLGYDGIFSIRQDNDGFIWIVMSNELYRFDGYQYKRYYTSFTKQSPEKEWLLGPLAVDLSGRLLVNTTNGLYLYKKGNDAFERIWDDRADNVKTDAHNTIWIWKYAEAQWYILDIDNNTLSAPLYDGESPHYISDNFCLHNEDVYVSSNYGKIYRYNAVKNEFTLCAKLPVDDGLVVDMKAYKGKLWVFTKKYGLYKIDLSSFAIESRSDFYRECGHTVVRSLHIDKTGNIWIGTINGLYVFNPDDESYTHYEHMASDPYSLSNNSIWTIDEDRQKNIWIGTYAGTVCYVNLDERSPFVSYFPRENELAHIPVSAFAEGRQGIWIGTEGGGLNHFDKQTGRFTSSSSSYRGYVNNLSYSNVKSLVVDGNQNVWIAMYTGGLDCFHTRTNRFEHFVRNGQKNALLHNNIRKIIAESDSGLWITYQYKKAEISFYSFARKEFTHYDFSKEDNQYYLFDMVRGRDNQLWILSAGKIFLMDVETHAVEEIPVNDSRFMNFFAFCMDNSGNLWIGTIGNGLIRYSPDTSVFTYFDDFLKYDISSVYSICHDDEGNIWMGTDNGLIQYHIADDIFSRYDEQDGVQGVVYYPQASLKGADGSLYFGGTNGFTIIKPSEIVHNSYKPNIILSGFFVDHLPSGIHFSPGDSLEAAYTIRLNHNQTNFGFQFSSDNYLMAQKNHFKYRLKGYDDRWIEVDASNRTAFYSKVPPGEYLFEALAANNDGIWGDVPVSVKIYRQPAPWLSWPAYTFYCLLASGILYLIFRYYYDRKKLKLQLYLENVEKNKKEEIHQAQLRFFTDISHDFRTPLSLIIASIHRLGKDGLQGDYHKILDSNAHRLLNLVNELMDFRTVENGKMKLEVQAVDINRFINVIASDFKEYALQRKINFKIIPDRRLTEVCIDKNKFEKIVMNLLNNAFKYTRSGGDVSIELRAGNTPFQSPYANKYVIEGDTPEETFAVIIRDTGIGISQESIESVFERFYKINTVDFDPSLGTGIGLALVKNFVLLHKGRLSIFSEKEKGTDIEVCFSADNSIYSGLMIEVPQTDEVRTLKPRTSPEPLEKNSVQPFLKNEKKRILLVEDHADLRKLIADALNEEYEVIQVENGMEASGILSDRIVELVISDIMMPEKDGITLCREVKNNIETSHIPVMLLTAKTGVKHQIEGADSGADIYLEKPVDFDLLKLTIHNIFKQQQQLKEHYAKNYFADSAGLSSNERDNKFLKDFIRIIEENMSHSDMDVNFIASELSMSRSKLYNKIKSMTGKSIIEFIMSQRLRKAARLIIEEKMSIREIMDEVGIESQAYFTNAFKKEFGETPTVFATRHK